MKRLCATLGALWLASSLAWADDLLPVDVYTQDRLLALIARNAHLQQIQADDCQLVDDIRYRAEHARYPAFQFLYGDMLLYGVCVEPQLTLGWDYVQSAAAQGLPEANEQIGRYYAIGRFVQQDLKRAMPYLRQAAGMDNVRAQMRYVQLLIDGHGTVHDYQSAYHWLYNSLIADEETHREAARLLAELEPMMSLAMVEQARKPRRF